MALRPDADPQLLVERSFEDRLVDRPRRVGHEHPGRRELGRQLTGADERRCLLAHLGAGERLALAGDVLRPVLERALGRTQGGGGEVVREGGAEREAEERRVVDRGARRGPGADLPRVDAPVVGDEGVGDDQRVGPGAAQPDRLPVVVDLVVLPRHEAPHERGHLVGPAGGRTMPSIAQLAWFEPARERPATGHPVPAVDPLERPLGRRERRRHHHVGVVAPHLLLRLLREEAHQPEVAGDEAEHPARRRVALGDLGDDLGHGLGAQLGTAPVRRLVDAHQPAGDELRHGLVGDAAQRLGLGASVHEVGGEVTRTRHRFLSGESGQVGRRSSGDRHRLVLRSFTGRS